MPRAPAPGSDGCVPGTEGIELMADLLFVSMTVAFFLAASGFVSLCNRILGSDSTPPTETRSKEILTNGARESADPDVTERKGVTAQ